MQTQHQQSFNQINKIIQLTKLLLQTSNYQPFLLEKNQNQKRFSLQNSLEKQLFLLKNYILKMNQNYQLLENQNKVLKRIVIKSNTSFSSYSDQIHTNSNLWLEKLQSHKYPIKVTSSKYSPQNQFLQNNSYLTQRNLYDSSSQFQKLKQDLVNLTENLKSMKKAYEKYQLDSTDDNEPKDIFDNSTSLVCFDSKNTIGEQNKRVDVDLEHLLCNQELSFEDLSLNEKSMSRINSEYNKVDSLIAKGIEFRESRALRSKEYQSLSDTIQKYREEFKISKQTTQTQKQSISKYR